MTTAAVELDRVSVRFGAVTAVDDVSLRVPRGAITALLGPNGAGKTTLVDVISGLRPPTAGRVRVLDMEPGSAQVTRVIGVMPQEGGLYPTARPLEWLEYLARLYPDPAEPRALLERVGLDPSMRTPARRMSGGEQQRLKLAAALLPRPRLLVLDEPTAGLDPAARRRLLDDLQGLRETGAAILLTTHLLADVEERADHVVLLAHGRITAQGTVGDLVGAPDTISITTDRPVEPALLTEALPTGARIETSARGLTVTASPTPDLIAAITARIASMGILVTELRVGGRTLEQLVIEAEGS
jgi:ABC-2 type transport system ATP-binding protein